MEKSTRTIVVLVALAALAYVIWRYVTKRKQREAQGITPDDAFSPTLETLGLIAPAAEGPALSPVSPPPSSATVTADSPLYITDEVEALARIMASETLDEGSQTRIGWVARNRAARRADKSIAKMVCNPCGRQVGNTRPFSSARPATKRTRELAKQILGAPASADPTRGALNILEPGLQDRLYAAGKTNLDANAVRRRWLKGLDYYGSVAGWDYFGPKGGAGKQPIPASWFGGAAVPVA